MLLHLTFKLRLCCGHNFIFNMNCLKMPHSGEDAPINELVDFIIAAQIAENIEKETDDMPHEDEGKNEVFIDVFM